MALRRATAAMPRRDRMREMELGAAAARSRPPAQATRLNIHRLRRLAPLVLASRAGVVRLRRQAASSRRRRRAPPVTVAQPVKRTVTDWDEFTGRFEAVEEVQVRARVGGFVTSVEFRDGAIVHAGDLLYVIDPRPFEAVAAAGQRPACPTRAPRRSLPSASSIVALTLVQTSAVSESGRRPAPPGPAGGACRRDCRPKAR